MTYATFYSGKTVALVGRKVRNEKAELFMQKYGFARISVRRTFYGRKRICCADEFWPALEATSIYLTIRPRKGKK